MREFGEVAVVATEVMRSDGCPPSEAWSEAVRAVFPDSASLQEKSCPRSTFLGLCEDGLVVGISSGIYTRSRDNKEYALKAVDLLNADPSLSEAGPIALWEQVMAGQEKAHNSQMDVVIALWQRGLIARPGVRQ